MVLFPYLSRLGILSNEMVRIFSCLFIFLIVLSVEVMFTVLTLFSLYIYTTEMLLNLLMGRNALKIFKFSIAIF